MQKQTSESEYLQNESLLLRKMENEKLEKEIVQHIDTRNRLLDLENKNCGLLKRIKEFERKLEDSQKINLSYSEEIEKYKTALADLQGNYSSQELQISMQAEREENLKQKQHKSIFNFKRAVLEILRHLRHLQDNVVEDQRQYFLHTKEQMSYIRSIYQLYSQQQSSRFKKLLQGQHENFEEVQKKMKKQEETHKKVLQEQNENISNQCEITLKKCQKEIETYRVQLDEAQQSNKILMKNINEIKERQKEVSNERDQLSKSCAVFQQEIKSNNDRVLALTAQLKQKVDTVKEDEIVEHSRRSNEKTTQKAFLAQLQDEITQLKKLCCEQLKALLAQLTVLKKQHEIETIEMVHSVEEEQKKSGNLLQRLNDLNEELEAFRMSHQSEQSILEVQVKTLNQSVIQSQEKYTKLKLEKNKELDEQGEKLRDMSRKLLLIQQQNEDIKMEYESKLLKSTQKLESVQTEHKKRLGSLEEELASKRKQIEELHSLLSRAYSSATSSIEQAKLAARLGTESEKLTKKVQESGLLRSHNPFAH